jgi:hypothetical protein
MSSFFGVYEALVKSSQGEEIALLIPQVFGVNECPCDRWVGSAPPPGTRGFVSFIGGDPAWPVWLGAEGIIVGGSP